MRSDSHRFDTGLEKHERRTFGICKHMVGAISPEMPRSSISSPPSSLSGPGADAECGSDVEFGEGCESVSGAFGLVISSCSRLFSSAQQDFITHEAFERRSTTIINTFGQVSTYFGLVLGASPVVRSQEEV
jgi:hypothetical protein